MPIPKPKAKEKEQDFVSRCMGNSVMVKDYPDQSQRAAICYSEYSKRKKKGDLFYNKEPENIDIVEENREIRFIKKDDQGFYRIVYAEVIIPNSINVEGDFHTEESVREFAYGFALNGYGLDIGHDNYDREDIYPVEYFIARENDPDFVPGSWVVGLYIGNDDIWQQIMNNELNGYSYEALVKSLPIEISVPSDATRYGVTEPNLYDGHVHNFFVILDDDGRVIVGGTDEQEGHSHLIRYHTFTEEFDGHVHTFNFVKGEGGI